MNVSCKKDHKDVFEAFDVLKEQNILDDSELITENKLLLKAIQDSAISQPEKYAEVYNESIEFHDKTNMLRLEIEKIKDAIKGSIGETEDYSKMDSTADSLLFTESGLAFTGLKLDKALKTYKTTTEDQLFFYPKAERKAKERIHIQKQLLQQGDSIDYFEYHYKGYPSIATLVKLSLLQKAALDIENTFLNELLEKHNLTPYE